MTARPAASALAIAAIGCAGARGGAEPAPVDPAVKAEASLRPLGPARNYVPGARTASHYVAAPLRPEPPGKPELDDFRRAILEAVGHAAAIAQVPAPMAEGRRHRVADELARSADGIKPPPLDVIRFFGNHYGLVEPEPGLTTLGGSLTAPAAAVAARYQADLPSFFRRAAWNRVGVGLHRRRHDLIAVVALWEQQLELKPFPRRLRSGGEARLEGRLLRRLHSPLVLVTTPAGVVRGLPVALASGGFSTTVTCAAGDGRYQVELMATNESGPAVMANFPIYCGVPIPDDIVAHDEERGDDSDPAGAEQTMFALINRERRTAGVRALLWDNRLAAVARSHSRDMARGEYVAHVSPTTGTAVDRVRRAGLPTEVVGENVGQAEGARQAHRGFMASPGHRASILDARVTHVGIGVVAGRSFGGEAPLFITQLFVGGI